MSRLAKVNMDPSMHGGSGDDEWSDERVENWFDHYYQVKKTVAGGHTMRLTRCVRTLMKGLIKV